MKLKDRLREQLILLCQEAEVNRPAGDRRDLEYPRIRARGLNLVKQVCGRDSDHYAALKRLSEDKTTAYNSYYMFEVAGILSAALQDLDAGVLMSTELRIRADVADDLLEQAEYFSENDLLMPAASLAGALLEDSLRKMCDVRGLDYGDHSRTTIDKLNTLLYKNEAYDKLVSKQVTVYANIRNDADHGHFEKLKPGDVQEFVKWLRRFLEDDYAAGIVV